MPATRPTLGTNNLIWPIFGAQFCTLAELPTQNTAPRGESLPQPSEICGFRRKKRRDAARLPGLTAVAPHAALLPASARVSVPAQLRSHFDLFELGESA
eukprot:6173288-Pleurochrysis_carterae.AAC.4